MAWLFLALAAFCQTVWTFSLKFADFKAIATLNLSLPVVGPVLLNIVSGLVNVFFLNQALRYVPITTAFGIWTALTLIFIKLADVFVYKAPWSAGELFFIGLLAMSIVGLKWVGGGNA